MKYILVVLFAIGTLAPNKVWADAPQFITADRAAHFGLSFVATEVGYAVGTKVGASRFSSWLFSALIVNAVGVVKETTMDSRADMNDIYSNAAGSVSAGLFVYTFDF